MKRLFEYIALISLLIFSFFLTDKTSIVIKNMDDLMIMINNNKKRYETKEIKAVINDKYITQNTIAEKLNVNVRTIKRNFKVLIDNNIVERVGSDKNGYWEVIN